MCKHANAFVWGFLWWAVSLKSSTMKSKTDELSKNIQNVSNSSIKRKVLRSDMTHYQNLDDPLSIKVGHSFEIRNPWKGRSVHLQLDGDINPSKNSWMRKCNTFDWTCRSHPLKILEFTLTFQIKSLKLFSLACMVILLIECYFWK